MNDSRNEELEPGYNFTKPSVIKGKRLFNTVSLLKKEAHPGDTYYVRVPTLSPNQVLIPDTMNVTFRFVNGNAKSRFKNNLGRILCKSLMVQIGGEIVYDNRGEGTFETYKDLWKSDSKREGMIEYGVANENIRKLMSGDNSATTSGKDNDVLLEKNTKVLKIRMGKILQGHGPYAPYGMSDVEYRFTLPQTNEILVAQTGQKLADYRLSDMNLEFETIEGEKLAESVRNAFVDTRDLWFDYTTLLKTLEWRKNSTRKVIDINIPRESMKAVVLLCTQKKPTDSEEFYNAEVESVKVTIEGNPNSVYSQGLKRSQIYEEAKRFFGTQKDKTNDNLTKLNFLKSKYALVIDMRTVDEENVVHSGRLLVGTQSGLLIEIEKLATSVDLLCHVFVVSDGKVEMSDQRFVRVEY